MTNTRLERPRRRAAYALAGFHTVGICAAACLAQAPLRYNFRSGDRLIYKRSAIVASLETGAVEQRITDQIQLWCLERDDNEALVLLDLVHFVDGRIEPVRGALLRIDMRGERRMEAAMLTRIAELDAAFDILPAMRSTLERGPAGRGGRTRHSQLRAHGSGGARDSGRLLG